MHDERQYPPNLSIMARSDTKQFATITMEVNGMKIEGQPDTISLKIPVRFDSFESPTPSEAATATTEVLEMASHFNILFTTLHKRVSLKWEDIASYLDIDPATV